MFLVLVLAAAAFHVAATASLDPEAGASFSGIWRLFLGTPLASILPPTKIGLLFALGLNGVLAARVDVALRRR